jgi:glycosyltransferase involved in cell wall biosynthesis
VKTKTLPKKLAEILSPDENKTVHIAIDGNEANVLERVGSNVYAFELLTALERLTQSQPSISCTILLATSPINDLPKARPGWQYRVLTPKPFWTQWALPLHLFAEKNTYSLFFTPGHYAPRLCPIPYVSSVMDTAYLDFPEHFKPRDLLQLKSWTAYSVKHARKVIAISKATKYSVIKQYQKNPADVVVAYPALDTKPHRMNPQQKRDFFAQHGISEPYVLFVGTLQPRKNVITLIEAFELASERWSSHLQHGTSIKNTLSPSFSTNPLKLVLAGKIGWMAESTLQRIARSPLRDQIILTGFISEAEKQLLIERSSCLTLLGLHEGFGIPPLEALAYGSIPVVSNTSSLPEVVGAAGFTVPPTNSEAVARILEKILTLPKAKRRLLQKKGRAQAEKFSWERSAKIVLQTLLSVAKA